MKIINYKLNDSEKETLNKCNRLLNEIDFEDKSKEMLNKIEKLGARQDDYIGLYEIALNDKYCLTIDIASGSSNYYDNIVIWEVENKNGRRVIGNEVTCLECNFDIEDIELSKSEYSFLDDDYLIKLM